MLQSLCLQALQYFVENNLVSYGIFRLGSDKYTIKFQKYYNIMVYGAVGMVHGG